MRDSSRSVNVGRPALPPRPVESPPKCPACHDTCAWVLNTLTTAYVAVCPWCSEYELPADEPEDFHEADTVAEPTPLAPDGEKGGA